MTFLFLDYYYYKRIWLKCHKVLKLQEHFTIEQEAEELYRTAISNRIQAETSREKFCLETAPEGWQWRRRDDTRRQAVPYTRSRDRKCAVADGGVARRRYEECRRWRRPKAPSRIYVRHSVEFIGECMAEPSNADNGMWAPLTWTRSAAAMAANGGRGAADSRAHASLLRKPAEQRRLARTGAD